MTTPLQFPPFLAHLKRLTLLPGLLLCLFFGPTAAHASAAQPILEQLITLQARDERMASVLSKIEGQANVHFQYSRLSPFEAARLAVMLPRPRYFETHTGSGYLASRARTIAARMGGVEVP